MFRLTAYAALIFSKQLILFRAEKISHARIKQKHCVVFLSRPESAFQQKRSHSRILSRSTVLCS